MRRMPPDDWRKYMKEMALACGEKFDLLGVCVRHTLMRAPSERAELLGNKTDLQPRFKRTWQWEQRTSKRNITTCFHCLFACPLRT